MAELHRLLRQDPHLACPTRRLKGEAREDGRFAQASLREPVRLRATLGEAVGVLVCPLLPMRDAG